MDGWMDGQTEGGKGKKTDGRTDRRMDGKTDEQMDRQTDEGTDGWIARQDRTFCVSLWFTPRSHILTAICFLVFLLMQRYTCRLINRKKLHDRTQQNSVAHIQCGSCHGDYRGKSISTSLYKKYPNLN